MGTLGFAKGAAWQIWLCQGSSPLAQPRRQQRGMQSPTPHHVGAYPEPEAT